MPLRMTMTPRFRQLRLEDVLEEIRDDYRQCRISRETMKKQTALVEADLDRLERVLRN